MGWGHGLAPSQGLKGLTDLSADRLQGHPVGCARQRPPGKREAPRGSGYPKPLFRQLLDPESRAAAQNGPMDPCSGTMIGAAATHAAKRIAELTHQEPEWLLPGPDGLPLAAVWSHVPGVTESGALPQHAVVLHLGGGTLVEKWLDGRLAGHGSRIGSFSLVPQGRPSTWVIEQPARVLHLYVDPAVIDGLALRDFFSVEDSGLALLAREIWMQGRDRTAPNGSPPLDALWADQWTQRLGRHLREHHALGDLPPPQRETRPLGLTTATLRRVYERIESGLESGSAGALRLRDLAAVACLSEDHFLRAFRLASGQSPGQFVQQRRLARAADLLRSTRRPLSEIARSIGFSTPSHFAAAFRRHHGITPRDYRDSHRRTPSSWFAGGGAHAAAPAANPSPSPSPSHNPATSLPPSPHQAQIS